MEEGNRNSQYAVAAHALACEISLPFSRGYKVILKSLQRQSRDVPLRTFCNVDCSLKDLKYRWPETSSCFHGLIALWQSRVNHAITSTVLHYQSEILLPPLQVYKLYEKSIFNTKSLNSYKVSKNAWIFFNICLDCLVKQF